MQRAIRLSAPPAGGGKVRKETEAAQTESQAAKVPQGGTARNIHTPKSEGKRQSRGRSASERIETKTAQHGQRRRPRAGGFQRRVSRRQHNGRKIEGKETAGQAVLRPLSPPLSEKHIGDSTRPTERCLEGSRNQSKTFARRRQSGRWQTK